MSTARGDLTGRARLRDAAIECFAAHGFDESLRAIASRILLVYILRSVREGGDAGRNFIEHMVVEALGFSRDAVARGIIVPSRDEEARVRFLVQQSIGAMVVSFAMRPEMPLDDFGAVMDRYYAEAVLPTLELYTEGLFTGREYLDEYLAFRAGTRNPPAGLAGETVTR